jgi:hypothetical protein
MGSDCYKVQASELDQLPRGARAMYAYRPEGCDYLCFLHPSKITIKRWNASHVTWEARGTESITVVLNDPEIEEVNFCIVDVECTERPL